MRSLSLPAAALLFGATLAASGPAARAQTLPVSYPPSRALTDIGAWLQRETPIAAGQVVDVSPSAVTAITAAQPTGQPRGFLASISSEALDPQILSHEGIASWSIPVEIDCEKRAVRLGVMTGFTGRDLRNDPKTVRDADAAWVTPTAAAPLGAVIRALCDRDFHRPLMGKLKAGAIAKAPEPAKLRPEAVAKAEPAEPRARAAPPLRPSLPPAEAGATAAKAKAAAAKGSAGGGSIAVQIGASPSKPDIEGLLTKAKKKFAGDMGGLTGAVATVEVDGKTVNRALISGFASSAEASAFCKKLSAEGQACFIRR
jgi:hypothetical protein